MIDTLKNILNISMSNRINFLIYYFKCIPIIGKLLKDTVYKEMKIKKIISIFAVLTKIVQGLLGPIAYVAIAIYLPIFFFYKSYSVEDKYSVFTYLLFVLSFVFGATAGSSALIPSKDKFVCVKLMKMRARDYAISIIFCEHIWDGVRLLPVLIIISKILGGTIFQGIELTLLLTMFRFCGEALHLFIFEKKNIILCKNYIFIIIYGILALITAYVPVAFKIILPVDKYLFNKIIILIIILIGIISIVYILKYKFYSKAFNDANKLNELYSDKHKLNEAKFEDVKINENEFKELELNSQICSDKEGYEYLNALFFMRHRKLLYKPMYIELSIIALIFLAALVVQIVFPSFMNEIIGEIDKTIPGLLLIMYSISNSRRITKAMFYNCDISLLRYGFYREKNVILKNFKIRLFKVAFINLIPATAIASSLMIIALMNGVDSFVNILPMVFMILILSLFFSVHDLFLYYIMQPYTTELNIKSPFFNIINGIVFWICYLSSKIKTPPAYFAGIVLVITVVYIIVALVTVYKLSWKTFKVK
ncbi:hypothetical protein [Clostridium saccharobutylicum]|uniref:Uncharacterized protein n=1 Tax=Clostridium saccharobutylicum TaxID=169679 RepID=A0A1S8N5P8_CLOSA|nr:hypothetical protein [Clostridium saccharobutylicum]OOM11839.1 hypothetical protein CLOSAC_22660 [Clostridium saccharobutylicum]